MTNQKNSRKEIPGVAYAMAAYIFWGFLPLFWKALSQVPAGEILAHRVIWSFLFVAVLLLASGRWGELKTIVVQRSKMLGVFLGAIFVSFNWFIYIWAVNSSHIVEVSLGYYINPLINVAFGLLFLKEKLNFWQSVSLILAAIGVGIITLQYGSIPWVALSLAVTFGLYGLAKKMTNIDAIVSLVLETAFILPVALIYVYYVQSMGVGFYGTGSWNITILLTCAGVVTALPLLLFAQGTRKVTLSTMGFIQYFSPSISLLIGVFVFKEAFTAAHALSFGIIWAALGIYALSRTPLLDKLIPERWLKAEQES